MTDQIAKKLESIELAIRALEEKKQELKDKMPVFLKYLGRGLPPL